MGVARHFKGGRMKKRFALLLCSLVAVGAAGAGQAGAATLIVDKDGRAAPPANCGANTPAPNSIEAAVEAAPPGSTVNVCPGVYTEQVSFENPDDNTTTIRSLVRWAAVIKYPPTGPANPFDDKAVVHVNGATDVRILRFTITGPGPSICDSIRYGVWVENNGSATIDENHITEIRDTDPTSLDPPLSGCQNGTAVQVGRRYVDGPTTGRATITDNLIDRYQKNGITVDEVGSRALIMGNRVRGAGPTPVIAQNGIQISRGAFGYVRGNVVSDNLYTGPAFASSSGILLYGNEEELPLPAPSPAPGTTVEDNRVFRNDDNIPAYGTELARIRDNVVLDAAVYDGIYMAEDSTNNRIVGNFLRRNNEHDCHDDSVGPGTGGTANWWIDNDGLTDNRGGALCENDDDDDGDDDDGDDDDDDDEDDDGHDDDDDRGDDD